MVAAGEANMKRILATAFSMLAALAGCSDPAGTCTYNGKTYKAGESFAASCNTCTCDAKLLVVACTTRACGPDGGGQLERGVFLEAGSCSTALTPLGRICVRGTPGSSGTETLSPGAVSIQAFPKGCLSSSCTSKVKTTCEVVTSPGAPLRVNTTFCLVDTSKAGGGCTADCNGGGWADCVTPGLSAGSYTVSADGGLTIMFDVPGTVPAGGLCQGQQF
jgi:hypothetical protein